MIAKRLLLGAFIGLGVLLAIGGTGFGLHDGMQAATLPEPFVGTARLSS